MNRDEKTNALIENDIRMIEEAWLCGDTELLWAVLSGDGWVPYNQLTDEQLDETYLQWSEEE